MNNELQVFHSSEFGNVRVIKVDGEPWFVAAGENKQKKPLDFQPYIKYNKCTAESEVR